LNLSQFAFLANENIQPAVVSFYSNEEWMLLRRPSWVWPAPETETLRVAFETARVVLTHDSDCGTLAVAAGQPVRGIVCLRPGHIDAQFTVASLEAILAADLDLAPPFLLVAGRRGNAVTIRVRPL
jgi:predicted nuclease of predicted toxin-antitoxin system